jgi:predicted RNA-binding Zn-ribbon protein involved in translation (DUF1610 family)
MRLIDEDAAIESLTEYGNGRAVYISVEEAVRRIEQLPSAQPEREKGEWVYNSPVTMKCNRCGLVIKDWDWHRFKICPNCGADMRRGEKDE